MITCTDCQQESRADEFNHRLMVCEKCIHSFWLTIHGPNAPGYGKPRDTTKGREAAYKKGRGQRTPKYQPATPEEIEQLRRDHKIVPGKESTEPRRK